MEKLVHIKFTAWVLGGEELKKSKREFEVRNRTNKNYVLKQEGMKGHVSVAVEVVDSRAIKVYAHSHKHIVAEAWCPPEEVEAMENKVALALLGEAQTMQEELAKCFAVIIESGYFDEKPKAPPKPKLKKATK